MISLVVPTFNERQNIAELVERTGKALAATREDYELIIVDDQSPDDTAAEVRRLQASRPWLKLLVRENEHGLSTAVLAGWRLARGDLWGCMDGDLQHPPEHLGQLVERLRASGAEIVIASRHVAEGGVGNWNLVRQFASWMATRMANLLLPSKLRRVRDPMSGFFILKRSVVGGVRLKPLGYKILLEVLARGVYTRTEEVGYAFVERASGASKMGPLEIWHYLLHLFRLWYETGEWRRIGKRLIAHWPLSR